MASPLIRMVRVLHTPCMQMEKLKRDMLAKIAETKAACEASIEAKAIELAEGLEAADRCPCALTAPPAWFSALPF